MLKKTNSRARPSVFVPFRLLMLTRPFTLATLRLKALRGHSKE